MFSKNEGLDGKIVEEQLSILAIAQQTTLPNFRNGDGTLSLSECMGASDYNDHDDKNDDIVGL
jgi:hypothetical protein